MKNTDNISVILVNTLYPGNIGAVARVMKNMGLESLVLVNPVDHLDREAKVMAVGAVDILETAKIVTSLQEAITGCTLVFGTTRRVGKMRQPQLTPWEMAELINESVEKNRVGIMFGSEDNGLTTDDLNLCHHIVQIPVASEFGSLNLSHAVAIVAYEMRKHMFSPPDTRKPRLASSNSVEDMFHHLQETLITIGFLNPKNPARIMSALKRMLARTDLQEREVKIIRGVLRQLNWYCKQNR